MKPSTKPAPNDSANPAYSWPHKQPDAGKHNKLHFAIWTLIYGGIVLFTAGLATGDVSMAWGWSLGTVGACATVAGFALMGVRSRIKS